MNLNLTATPFALTPALRSRAADHSRLALAGFVFLPTAVFVGADIESRCCIQCQ